MLSGREVTNSLEVYPNDEWWSRLETATANGINVQRVLSEEVVGNPKDNLDSDDAWGGIATSDSSDDDEDGGSGKGGGNTGTGFVHGQFSTVGGLNNFSSEENYDHASHDHGYRSIRYGAQEDTMYGRRTRGPNDDQDVVSVALSFDSISLGSGTGTSNESQEGNNQYGYNVYGYNQCTEVSDQSSSFHHPYYPLIGETVGSSKDIYDYHIQHYNLYYMSHMSWSDYCTFVDQRVSYDSYQQPRFSFWM